MKIHTLEFFTILGIPNIDLLTICIKLNHGKVKKHPTNAADYP